MTADSRGTRQRRRIRATAGACLGFAGLMVGVAFASAPLYSLFCRLTGYDGTPLVGKAAPGEVLARKVTVRLDANVAPGLNWSFAPETSQIEARVGETQTVFFRARNEAARSATGIATYNVQPGQAGAVFVKLKCFCFEDQTLAPGEAIEFPVAFYIDPAIAADRNLDGLSSITLSYTYFASRNGQPVASVDGSAAKPKL